MTPEVTSRLLREPQENMGPTEATMDRIIATLASMRDTPKPSV